VSTQFTQRALKLYFKNPLPYIALQLPQVIPEVLERFLLPGAQNTPTLALLPKIVPYFMVTAIATFWSSAAIFVAAEMSARGVQPSLKETAHRVNQRLSHLIPAGLLAGVTVLVGYYAYFIPGIILTALYLFVPQLIMDGEPNQVMVYFNRSWKLTSRHFLQTLGVVIVTTSFSVLLYVGSQLTEARVSSLVTPVVTSEVIAPLIAALPMVVISLVIGSLLDVWVASYYLEMRDRSRT
jgi:hypothetical protein